MPFSTVSTLKFVGTVSLGIFTGASYAISSLALPALLALPSAPQARHAYVSLQKASTLHLRTLAAVSTLAFPLAFVLSPARFRHPYLLWTGTAALLGTAADFLLPSVVQQARVLEDEDAEANGEMVEGAVRALQTGGAVKAAVGLVGFAMGLVGLWGDGA